MADRYSDAVRARRTELADARALLGGTHRAELRSELALSRLAASEAVDGELARLRREVRRHLEHPGRAARERLPGLTTAALARVAALVHARWAAELAPALRRIALSRSLEVGLPPDWPALPAPRLPVLAAAAVPERARPARSLLAGAADGLALWRLVLLPLALLPLLGLPVLGGPALAPLAVGAGAAAALLAVRSRRLASHRAGLLRFTEATVAAARVALEADVGRRVLEVERAVGAELDLAVARRRGAVEAELRALAPGPAVPRA